MKKFTKKELEKIRKYFNEILIVDQNRGWWTIYEDGVNRGGAPLCLFCHLAVALDWGLGSFDSGKLYGYIFSYDSRLRKEKRRFFYDRLLTYLRKKCGAELNFSEVELDGCYVGLVECYNGLIKENRGKFGDFLVEKVLI